MRRQNSNYCPHCKLHQTLCICELISALRPRLAHIKIRTIILMHFREERLESNTARLAAMTLPNCEIRVRGQLENPMSTEGFSANSDEQPSFLLFPSEDAAEITPEFTEQIKKLGTPPTLIIPDGSWRQASKMCLRIPELRNIRHLKLPAGAKAQYHLRHSHHSERVSTFEAIARTVGLLEDPSAQREMEIFFEKRVERGLWARGKIRQENCRHPIPPAFFDFFRKAGMAGSTKKSKSEPPQ